MTSKDIYVVINGQTYRIDGEILRPQESNFQQEVLRRLDGIDARLERLESRVGVIESDVTVIKHDQAMLQTSVYWGIGIIGIFLAAIQLWPRKNDPAPQSQPIFIQLPPQYIEKEQKSA